MSVSIESSISLIEELVSSQNPDQNAMLLYFANFGRSLESPFIRFCIDNPYAFPENDINNILRYLTHTVIREKIFADSCGYEKTYQIYSESRKNCYLLWLCSVYVVVDESIYGRLSNIFSQLEVDENRLPAYLEKLISNIKLNQFQLAEINAYCKYKPSFLGSYHVCMSEDVVSALRDIKSTHQYLRSSFPRVSIFDEEINIAIAFSHYIPLEIIRRQNKSVTSLSKNDVITLYIFCLCSLYMLSNILGLNYDKLSVFACLTLLNEDSKLQTSDTVPSVFKSFATDVSNPSMFLLLEEIKREMTLYVYNANKIHLDNLVDLFLCYSKRDES